MGNVASEVPVSDPDDPDKNVVLRSLEDWACAAIAKSQAHGMKCERNMVLL